MIPRFLIVHHTSGSNTDTVETLRKMHMDKGWSDIGYHKIIYRNGTVHQGRDDAVQGAQAFGINPFSLGIVCIGNYDVDTPPKVVINALINTLVILCKRHHLDERCILGHNEVAKKFNIQGGATNCPGRNIISQMDYIRKTVSNYLK